MWSSQGTQWLGLRLVLVTSADFFREVNLYYLVFLEHVCQRTASKFVSLVVEIPERCLFAPIPHTALWTSYSDASEGKQVVAF